MSRSVILTVLVAATSLLASACAQEASDNPFELSTGTGEDGEQPETPEALGDVVSAALDDVQRFWEEMYPEVYGSEFEPISGGFHPYGPDTEQPPCGNPAPEYDEIANNAFYCPSDDLIAWDEDQLIPQLADEFGKFTIGIVFAHEFGHAIQFRGEDPESFPTVVSEMQADCFAGAWTRWIQDGNSDDFAVTEDELDQSVAGMIAISDVAGTEAADPMAHGSGFDRIGSFQDGFEHGATRCAEYDEDFAADELPIVEIPFFDAEEAANEGDMALEDQGPDQPGLLSLAEGNLNLFYRILFEEEFGQEFEPVEDLLLVDPSSDDIDCDGESFSDDELEFASGYCQDENVVVIDVENLVPALYEVGDFAVGAELARLWAQAAQLQLDVDTDDIQAASLQADCLTGVWAAANFPLDVDGSTQLGEAVGSDEADVEFLLQLSAGDLDEAIQGFLTYGDAVEDQAGTAFERTAALRSGFVGGVSSCEEFASLG